MSSSSLDFSLSILQVQLIKYILLHRQTEDKRLIYTQVLPISHTYLTQSIHENYKLGNKSFTQAYYAHLVPEKTLLI